MSNEKTISIDIPGAAPEAKFDLILGNWKKCSGSPFEVVPLSVKAGDAYRLLWVIRKGSGQIRMYTETVNQLILNGDHSLDRWEAVDGTVEDIVGKSVKPLLREIPEDEFDADAKDRG